MNISEIQNEKMKSHSFLKGMYEDDYFPNHIVDKGKLILLNLCTSIENKKPQDLQSLYELTHAATDKFNDLDEEFNEADSEIETVAREIIAEDFEFIAAAYGFESADIEELIATRDW